MYIIQLNYTLPAYPEFLIVISYRLHHRQYRVPFVSKFIIGKIFRKVWGFKKLVPLDIYVNHSGNLMWITEDINNIRNATTVGIYASCIVEIYVNLRWDLEILWGLNHHQSKGMLTEIHNYWLIQLGNRIMSRSGKS